MKDFAIGKATRRVAGKRIPKTDESRMYREQYVFPSYSLLVKIEDGKGKVVFSEDGRYERLSVGSNLARDSYAEVCRRVEEHEWTQKGKDYVSLFVQVRSYMYQSENWYTVWTSNASFDEVGEYYESLEGEK